MGKQIIGWTELQSKRERETKPETIAKPALGTIIIFIVCVCVCAMPQWRDRMSTCVLIQSFHAGPDNHAVHLGVPERLRHPLLPVLAKALHHCLPGNKGWIRD